MKIKIIKWRKDKEGNTKYKLMINCGIKERYTIYGMPDSYLLRLYKDDTIKSIQRYCRKWFLKNGNENI